MRSFITYLLIVFSINCYCQDNFKFRNYTIKENLPSNKVNYLYQDKNNFIWVGTGSGACRLQSNSTTFTILNDLSIESIEEDYLGRLWFGTNGGLYIYDSKTNECKIADFNNIGNNSFINSILRDDKNMWIATSNNGIICKNLENGSESQYNVASDSLPSNTILDIDIDNEQNIWATTDNGWVIKINKLRNRVGKFNIPGESRSESLKVDAMGMIWIGGWIDGLYRFNPFNEEFERFDLLHNNNQIKHIHSMQITDDAKIAIGSDDGLTYFDILNYSSHTVESNYSSIYSINDKFIYSVLIDRYGGLWLGTYYGGVSYLSGNSRQFEFYNMNNHGINGRVVSSFSEDNRGDIWIGSDDAGVVKFSRKDKTFEKIDVDKTIEPLNVQSILCDGNNMWIGTYANSLYLYDIDRGKSVANYDIGDIHSLHITPNGDVWAGGSYLFCKRSGEKQFVSQSDLLDCYGVFKISSAPDSTLWIMSYNHGLSYCKDGKVTHLTEKLETVGIKAHLVITFFLTDEGVFVGTHGKGILYYNLKTERLQRVVTQSNKLNSASIKYLDVIDNILWATTNVGLFKYNMNNGEISIFTSEDGLQSRSFNPLAGLKTRNREIVVGGSNGFNIFDPSKANKIDREIEVSITDLTVINNKDSAEVLENRNYIKLKHNHKALTISYTTAHYSTPSKIKYRYRVLNMSDNYIENNNLESITFSNLSPGEYIFEIAATISNRWDNSPVTRIEIYVSTPWWSSTIMRLLYILLFAAIIAYIFIFLLRRNHKRHILNIENINIRNQQKLVEAKVNFFTDIAHEIRTPATLIIAPIEKMINRESNNPVLKEELMILQKNGNRLIEVINQIVDYNNIGINEQITERYDMINVNNLVTNIISQFHLFADYKHITISFDSQIEDTKHIESNKEALTKILINLITNGCKFAKESVIVKIYQDDKEFVFIEIIDDGVGIPEENLEKIFLPFFTTNGNNEHLAKGFGIGLSIVKKLADKFNFTIECHSKENVGTRFLLSLGVKAIDYDTETNNPEEISSQQFRNDNHSNITPKSIVLNNKTILIAEDNRELAAYIKNNFETNYNVVLAANGIEALSELNQRKIDLIITDLSMPLMGGLELCKRVKSENKYKHIPIIMLSARIDSESKLTAYNRGVLSFIEKPISMTLLSAQIEALFGSDKNSSEKIVVDSDIKIPTSDKQLLLSIKEMISENLSNPNFSIDDISTKLNVSRSTIYSKVKTYTNTTPNELLKNCRLERSAELLKENNYNIAEICYMVGFSSPSYFTKCFYEYYKVKPSNYR